VLARPLRGLGAAGHLAGTALSANRWRSAALATPILLVAMLAGTQATLQASDEHNTEAVTAERITATHAVVGRDGAPLPADTSARLARLPGVEAATATLPTEVFLLDHGLSGWDAPWAAAGIDVAGVDKTLDLHVLSGDLEDVGRSTKAAGDAATEASGAAVAVSDVVASEGDLAVGDVVSARMADTRRAELRVVAIYDRAAGLGHVVLDASDARRHAVDLSGGTVLVAGGDAAARSLARYAAAHPGIEALTAPEYLETVEAANQEDAWAIWLIIAMSVGFAALALVNTAAMATTERRDELATIRLLGGTSGQATRMIALELVPTVAAGLLAGGAVAALAVMGVPDGVRGIPLVVPVAATGGLLLGAALLGLAAGVVAVRLALRSTPAAALRVRE
jgi:putative ABC transport system permease protein